MIRGVLFDEHYPGWWPPAILRQYAVLDLRVVGRSGAPPTGTKDPLLLQWVEAHDFVLVTEDRKTMLGHLNRHLPLADTLRGYSSLTRN